MLKYRRYVNGQNVKNYSDAFRTKKEKQLYKIYCYFYLIIKRTIIYDYRSFS